MTWWGWLLLALYLVGCLIAWPRIAWVIAKDLSFNREPTGVDVIGGLFFGALGAAVWPPIFLVYRWLHFSKARGITGSFLLVPPRPIREEARAKRTRSGSSQA